MKADQGDAPARSKLEKLCVEDPLTLRCAPPSRLPSSRSERLWYHLGGGGGGGTGPRHSGDAALSHIALDPSAVGNAFFGSPCFFGKLGQAVLEGSPSLPGAPPFHLHYSMQLRPGIFVAPSGMPTLLLGVAASRAGGLAWI